MTHAASCPMIVTGVFQEKKLPIFDPYAGNIISPVIILMDHGGICELYSSPPVVYKYKLTRFNFLFPSFIPTLIAVR